MCMGNRPMNAEELVVDALRNNVRVNESTNTVEIYDDYGVKTVLTNLDEDTIAAFKAKFRTF